MNIRPVGYMFLRGGAVLPRHMAVAEPSIKRFALPTDHEGYDFVTPQRGMNGEVPRLTLYGPDGRLDTMYFGPAYGKWRKPSPQRGGSGVKGFAGAYGLYSGAAPLGGEPCEACKIGRHKDEAPEAPVTPKQLRFPSVQLFTAVCPDCTRIYVSGGLTEARYTGRPDPARLDAGLLGQYIDRAV